MRNPLLFLLFCTLFAFSTTLAAFDNVLVISIDTLRADYLSCYGSKKVKTPNIDALAATGVLFKNTVSSVPFTLPSHASLLTGMIPPVHGVEDNSGFYLDKRITTMTERFKVEGWNTAAFVGAFPLDSRFGLDQGFDVYNDRYPTVNDISEMAMPERQAEEVADDALKWLTGQTKNRWFTFVHFYDPHFPYQSPDRFKKMYPDDLYAAEIAYTDEQVGRILTFLRNNHLEKKTLVVLVGDHGESLGEHEEKTHGIFAYESTLRVPFIMAPFPSKVIETRIRLIDVAPTVLALQKVSSSGQVQGRSLTNFLETSKVAQLPVQDSYFEALSMHFNMQWAPLRGFYSENYKFISLPVPELYDLSKDPKETKNLCENKPLCDKWSARFSAFSKPFLKTPVSPAPVDPETAEQLRALGYISGPTATPKKSFGPEDDPKKLISLHNRIDLALAYFKKGYELKALEILEKVIEEKPDYTMAYMHSSFIQARGGFPDKAAETLKEALKKGVSGLNVYGKLGLYLYESGKYEEAIEHLKLALPQDSRDLDIINYLGMAYTASGKYPEAESTFLKALALDPSDGMTLNNLGTLYLTQKKHDQATKKFQEALAANPHVASAYNGLGVIYATQKNWDEAIKHWSLAVQEDPKNFDAMLNLAYAYLQRNDKEKALPLLEDFQKNAPIARYAQDLRKVRSIIRQLQ